jgi:phage tail-like protein
MVKKSGLGSTGKPTRKYYQHNYVDVIKSITPNLYHDTDHSIYGLEDDISYSVLGKILKAVDEIATLVDVSGVDASSLQSRFILRNNLTNIKPYLFEHKILKPLGSSFKDFTNKEDFNVYLSGVLLPHIHTNKPSSEFISGVTTYVDSTLTTELQVHNYLIDNLSWMYMLNTSGPASGFDPSSRVSVVLSELYDNKPVQEKESIQYLFEHLWRNREVSTFYSSFVPNEYNHTVANVSGNTYASGTQLLDGLKTLVGVWYNNSDESSDTLDTYLDLYLTNGTFSPKQVEAGSFTKFLQAVSYGFYDVNSTIQELEDLVDIERCPPQFLQYLASLIGWQLLTGDVDRWRAQLRKAVYLYKSKGTKRCLEDAVNLIFPGADLSVADEMQETWECFLPRMIYYLIATESPVLNTNFTENSFSGVPSDQYFPDNLDLNYRAATDYVLKVLHDNAPVSYNAPEGGAIYINKKKFDLSSWDPEDPDFEGFYHRGKRGVKVPPWENDRFYDNTFLSPEQILILNDVLTGSRDVKTTNTPLGGLEIPASYVGSLSSILEKDGYSNTVYDLSWNKKWKFYTSGLEVAPNLDSVIAAGKAEKLNLLDFWSSKSSLAFTAITLSDIKHSVEGISLDTDTILGNIQKIFKSFAPFHVVIKLFAQEDFTDQYIISDAIDTLCLRIQLPMYDATTSGDTDQIVLTNHVRDSVSVSSDGYSQVITQDGTKPRTSGRRRNLRYSLRNTEFRRNGRSMPVAQSFNSTSGVEGADTSTLDIHTTEFIPLGYNFSAGRYFSPSGAFSGIYDASNDLALTGLPIARPTINPDEPGTDFYLPFGRANLTHSTFTYSGIEVSSTFPCRGILREPCTTAQERDNISNINRIIINKLITQGFTDDFSVSAMENFEFGSVIHKDFYKSGGLYASSTMVRDNANDVIPYSEKEIKTIYSYFNSLVSGKQSRVHTNTEALYATSGGSRSYYIENMGGLTSASGGTSDSASPYGTGILYAIDDD